MPALVCDALASKAAAIYRAVEPAREAPHERRSGAPGGDLPRLRLRLRRSHGAGAGRADRRARRRPARWRKRWFGDGHGARRDPGGRAARDDRARRSTPAAARSERRRGRPLVLIAPDLTTEAQRTAIALADTLRAEVDGATSDSAAAGILVAQRRGRAAATPGRDQEPSRRGAVLGGGSRRALPPLPGAIRRRGLGDSRPPKRTLLSVSVGADRGPDEAGARRRIHARRRGGRAGRHAGDGPGSATRRAAAAPAAGGGDRGAPAAGRSTSRSSTMPRPGGKRETPSGRRAWSPWLRRSTAPLAPRSAACGREAIARARRRRSPGRPATRCG